MSNNREQIKPPENLDLKSLIFDRVKAFDDLQLPHEPTEESMDRIISTHNINPKDIIDLTNSAKDQLEVLDSQEQGLLNDINKRKKHYTEELDKKFE